MTAPELSAPAAEPVLIQGVEVLQAAFEHAGTRGDVFLPAGLVPTIPTLVTLLTVNAPDGPHGAFAFAQVRVSCRSGARARALVVAGAVDASPETAAWLAAGWGIASDGDVSRASPRAGERPGSVDYERRFDRVTVSAPWFDLTVAGPKPIGVHDVQYVAGLHPVTTAAGERLAQVELDVALDRVERARPVLSRFTAPDAAPALDPRFAVAATSGVGTLTLPRVRFVLRPDLPPHLGTEKLASAR